MCISAILGVGSALIGKSASDKATGAQVGAANNDLALRSRIYDETVERFDPFYQDGRNYAAVRNFLDFGGDSPTIGGTAPTIEEITSGGTERYQVEGGRAEGDWRTRSTPTTTRYSVGGQEFDDRAAAQEWANANRTGGQQYGGLQETPGYQFAVDQGTSAIEGSAAARGGLYSGRTMQDLNKFGQGIANQEFNNYYNRIAGGAAQGQAAAGQQAQAGQNYAQGASNAFAGIGNAQAAGAMATGNALQGGLSNALGLMNYQNSINGGQANMLSAPWASKGFW